MTFKGCTLWFFSVLVAISYAGEYTGDKVIRIFPKTTHQLKILGSIEAKDPMKYDFWTDPGAINRSVDIHIRRDDYSNFSRFLDHHGINHKVLMYNLQSVVDHQNDLPSDVKNDSSISWYEKYHPYEEIIEKINDLYENRAGDASVELFTIGSSGKGRELMTIKIKGASSSNKPVMFINCGIHAREWVSPPTCIYMIDKLVNEYGHDSSITSTLDKIDFIILPVLNPDGYIYSWEPGRRMWRKNTRPRPSGNSLYNSIYCDGVDLNRNFPFNWDKEVGSKFTRFMSTFPCSPIYKGPERSSESEVQAVVDYLTALKQKENFMAYFDIHSYSQMWMLPFGFTTEPPPDHDEQERVALIGKAGIASNSNKTYQVGISSQLLYSTTGTTKDFVYGQLKVPYTYIIELRDKGERGFLLPSLEILPTAQEILSGIQAMVEAIDLTYETKL